MLPRNPNPMQRSFMMPSNRQYGQMPYRQSQHPMMMSRPPQTRQGGGLLAKLLGNQNQQGSGGVFGGIMNQNTRQSGSLMKTLTNPSNLNGFLTNTQKVLNTAQQVGPMIQQFQQYSPILKNLPAMWKLYRGLKDMPDQEQTGEESHSENHSTTDAEIDAIFAEEEGKSSKNKDQETNRPIRKNPGPSIPKMYI